MSPKGLEAGSPCAGVVAVAASGGRDSTALLHATARQARELNLHVVALHVHHGLEPLADDWLKHLQRQCRRWARQGLPLSLLSTRLNTRPEPGQSVEAWARRERYQALARMAQKAGASLLLLAHHRRDQAETVLLQALRGSTARGWSAMPAQQQRGNLVWARPWLGQSAQALEHYVRRWGLSHITDSSNTNTRFDRNRLRLEVWPSLLAAFPQAENTLAQSARHAQQARALADEVAQALLPPLLEGDALCVKPWLGFPTATRLCLLKAWLDRACPHPVPDSLLERLAVELRPSGSAVWPGPGGSCLRLYQGMLRWAGQSADAESQSPAGGLTSEWEVSGLSLPARLDLPIWQGQLVISPCTEGGVSNARLERLRMTTRQGGEQFQSHAGGIPRSLKKQYQAAGVPAWLRKGPLIWSLDGVHAALLYVPGLGLDARLLAREGEAQWCLSWRPNAALDHP